MKSKNNPIVNLLFNIVIPIIILTKFSDEAYLGPLFGLLIALSFPLVYGLYEFVIQKQKNFISILGFVGVLISGVIGILKFPPHWIAVKEAAIPLIIGLAVLISTNTSWQLLKKFVYNRELLDVDQIEARLFSAELRVKLDLMLKRANLFFASSFFLSAILNYYLAKVIVTSMPGSIAFNEEIGRMTMLSFPIIAVPSVLIMIVIFWYIISSLKKLTQLSSNELYSEKMRSDK